MQDYRHVFNYKHHREAYQTEHQGNSFRDESLPLVGDVDLFPHHVGDGENVSPGHSGETEIQSLENEVFPLSQ